MPRRQHFTMMVAPSFKFNFDFNFNFNIFINNHNNNSETGNSNVAIIARICFSLDSLQQLNA